MGCYHLSINKLSELLANSPQLARVLEGKVLGRCGSTVPVSCLGTRRGAASAVPVSCLGTRGNNAVVRLCEEERDDDMCHPWHVLTRWLVAGRPCSVKNSGGHADAPPTRTGHARRCSVNTSAPGMVGMVRHLLLAPLPLLPASALCVMMRCVTSRRTGKEVKRAAGVHMSVGKVKVRLVSASGDAQVPTYLRIYILGSKKKASPNGMPN